MVAIAPIVAKIFIVHLAEEEWVVERGRMVWELMAGPCLEHAAEVWWPGGKVVGKKLESIQEKVGRKPLGASDTVVGVAVHGKLGWKQLEEGREEK
jgi:hypothetical protein